MRLARLWAWRLFVFVPLVIVSQLITHGAPLVVLNGTFGESIRDYPNLGLIVGGAVWVSFGLLLWTHPKIDEWKDRVMEIDADLRDRP
jgi:hypothetical protein